MQPRNYVVRRLSATHALGVKPDIEENHPPYKGNIGIMISYSFGVSKQRPAVPLHGSFFELPEGDRRYSGKSRVKSPMC